MERGAIGRYMDGAWEGKAYSAFLPSPLPPNPPLELGDLMLPIVQTVRAIGRMDFTAPLLPNRELLTYSYIRKEAVLSSQIEGSQSSLSDLMSFEISEAPGVPTDDVKEVSNYVKALEHGLSRIDQGEPVSNRLIKELHGILLSSGRGSEKYPGQFRHDQNWINGNQPSNHPGNAAYVPPFAEDVEPCMRALERFIGNQDDGLPSLIRAGLVHVQFETIHPFFDGNGRIGRLLILLILYQAGDLQSPALSPSLYLLQHRSLYYQMLERVRSTGDWEVWLTFFLEGIRAGAEDAFDTVQRLSVLFEENRTRIRDSGYPVNSALRVHDALQSHPIQSLSEITEQTRLTFPTVATAMENLTKLGIAREITGGLRNRIFVYIGYLVILNEGTAVQ